MRFRLGVVIGFGAGYYVGSAAGRERHEQINRAVARIRRTDTLERATDKAKAVIDLTVERARDAVETRLPEPHATPSPVTGATTNGSDSTYSSSK
jgi:hypothetical protein